MKTADLKYKLLSLVSILAIIIIVVVPFQGFLPIFGYHLFGHYTAFRLWDEVALLIAVIGTLVLMVIDHKIRFNTLYRRLVWVIIVYILLNLSLGLIAYVNHGVTAKALGYGLIVNLRYLLFFLITLAVALRMSKLKNSLQKIVIIPAIIVIVFGLLQIFILPHDFLKYFGYGPRTIPITETINNNSRYIRIASTLRGANPLGAYMIIPLSFVLLLLIRSKKLDWQKILFLLSGLIVLFFSFSRSAYLGAILSFCFILLMSDLAQKHLKKILGLFGVALVILLLLFGLLHNNKVFQNFAFHTQTNSKVKTTSDAQHASALIDGVKAVIHNPLGKGPGTSGPASYYNHHERNPEDYYLQIAEEDGVVGLILFLTITVGIGYILWLRRDDPLALFLLASLIGISFVNLLAYAWSDDTLAYIWWGLAGIAMVTETEVKKYTKNIPKMT